MIGRCSQKSIWLISFGFLVVVCVIYYISNGVDLQRFFGNISSTSVVDLTQGRKISKQRKPHLVILLYTQYFGREWTNQYPLGETTCPSSAAYPKCVFTNDLKRIHFSDVLMFHGNDLSSPNDMRHIPRNPHQIWIFAIQENPFTTNTGVYKIKDYDDLFNWTATYHRKSHVVMPYYDVNPIKNGSRSNGERRMSKMDELIATKTKLVMSIMSNCVRYRIDFVKNLGKYIQVDLYGSCKNQVNPELEQCERDTDSCKTLQKSYKFFLAVENSYCTDYITEKFYKESLEKGLVPIVLNGAKMLNPRIAPPGSFINVLDFKNAQQLAKYIKYLDGNDTAYLEYHRWRNSYDVLPHNYACNLCKTLNIKFKSVRRWPTLKLSKMWNAKRMCTRFEEDELLQRYLH